MQGANTRPPHVGGYGKGAGPRSITVTGALQNGARNSGPERNFIQNAYNQIPSLSVEGTNEQVTAWSVAKHAHHGPDFGINLPDNFDMNHYENLDREGRIEYADKHVPRETIIDYQNEIGKAMTVDDTIHVDGFVGKYKKDVDFKISNKKGLLSVVNERGEHISTYGVTRNKLRRIIKDGFWIWKNRII